MSVTFCKSLSAIILAFVVFINTIGNFIGVGDIIPTAPAETTTAVAESLPVEDETETPEGMMTKSEFVAFLNSETAKAAEGSYDFSRSRSYIDPIDVGGATGILNSIIGAIDEDSNLDSVVGDFIGIGTKSGHVPENYLKDDYKLKATFLTEADLRSFTASEDGVYTFTLANATNPKKTGETSLSRFTDDFITHEEVADSISDFTTAITLKDSTVTYKNIFVSVTVAEGKITNVSYSYDFEATLSIKAGVTINGSGSVATNAKFSNIEY